MRTDGMLVLSLLVVSPVEAQQLPLPVRPASAPVGSVVASTVRDVPLREREVILQREVVSGNVPDFLRQMVPITVARTISGAEGTVTFWVAPDYLAVGTNADHFRIPLSPEVAQQVADASGASLPTPMMVDAIWRAAEVQLGPDSIAPSAAMITVPVFLDHDRMVHARRAAHPAPLGRLVAGHKKDVVLSRRLDSLPTRVAIYGWHKPNGVPIQPLNTWHTTGHVDYSHGIRLVWDTIAINGVRHSLRTVLRDSVLAPWVSDEGAMRAARYSTTIPAGRQ